MTITGSAEKRSLQKIVMALKAIAEKSDAQWAWAYLRAADTLEELVRDLKDDNRNIETNLRKTLESLAQSSQEAGTDIETQVKITGKGNKTTYLRSTTTTVKTAGQEGPAVLALEAAMAHPGGRPRLKFNLKLVEYFGEIGSSFEDMAALLECDISTVSDYMNNPDSEFSKSYKSGAARTRNKLRAKQIKLALDGNATTAPCTTAE